MKPEPKRHTVCAAEGGTREVKQAPWRVPENYACVPEVWHSVLYCWSLVLLCSDCVCALVLPP